DSVGRDKRHLKRGTPFFFFRLAQKRCYDRAMWSFLRLAVVAVLVKFAVCGADLAGFWMGETTGRNGEKQDVAFQFKASKGSFVGIMFGDEVDLPVEDLKIEGDKISFVVTTINYYNGSRFTLGFSGSLSDNEMRVTRERKGGLPNDRRNGKQEITLKRITSRSL